MASEKQNAKNLHLIIAYLGLSGCQGLVPTPPEPTQTPKNPQRSSEAGSAKTTPLDPESWAQRLSGLKENAENIAGQVTEINNKLSKVLAVKNSLCDRQTELISSCIVHTPLSPSQWRQAAACKAERKIWDVRGFYVDLRGLAGRFQIILDNNIESNIFEPNKVQSLQWSSRGSRSLRELKLSDINLIKLKAVEGNLDTVDHATFKLGIDDKTIFTEANFIASTRTSNAITLSHVPISDELSTPACRVDDDEIETLIQLALTRAERHTSVQLPGDKSSLSWELRAREFEEWILKKKEELSAKTDVYLASATEISRIRRDLRGELQLGCWGKQVIDTIEVEIDGTHLPLADWDRSQTNEPLGTRAFPKQTTIDFGGGLRFTNADEDTLTLFRAGGRWLLDATTDLTIGDISSIQMQKGGYSYESFKNCWSTWGGLSTACEWQNRESNRYQMTNLSIRINGQLIYQKNAINIVFERDNMRWLEQELTSNQAYINLMRRRDCPVSLMPD